MRIPGRYTLALATLFLLLQARPAASQPVSTAAPTPGYGIYVEGGRTLESRSAANALGIGFMFPWGSESTLWGGSLTRYGDVFLSNWDAPHPSGYGHRDYAQLVILATWRLRFDEGRSPWFADAGVGVSTMDKDYQTPDRGFSTRFQFTEAIGIGRSFGETQAHELSLRFQHFSNAGLRRPNPGANFLRLRYAYRF